MESGWEPEIRLKGKAESKLHELLPDIDADRFDELKKATEDTLMQFHWVRTRSLNPSEIRQSAKRLARLAGELNTALVKSEIAELIDSELRRRSSINVKDLFETLPKFADSAGQIAAWPIPKGRSKSGIPQLVEALVDVWQEYTGTDADRETKGSSFYKFIEIVLPQAKIVRADYRSIIQPK